MSVFWFQALQPHSGFLTCQLSPTHPSQAEHLGNLVVGQGGALGDELWALALAEELEGAILGRVALVLGLVRLGEGARFEVESKT